MHSDSYFCIGSTHNVCQDYALAGISEKGKAFAIISDGCSGSPDTDWGSRFMVRSLQSKLEPNRGAFFTAIAAAEQMASSCNMRDSRCLDATLLVALEAEQDGRQGVWAAAVGDGAIIARHRGRSTFDIHAIDFYDGYPAYVSYMGDLGRMLEYIKHTKGGLASIRVTNGETGEITPTRKTFYSLEDTSWLQPYEVFFDKEKYDLVMLVSDGISTFVQEEVTATSKHHSAVPMDTVLTDLTDFKNLKGEFVVRRLKRFLSKTCVDKKWIHHDDLSVAVVSMD